MLYVIDNGTALDRRVFVDGDHCVPGRRSALPQAATRGRQEAQQQHIKQQGQVGLGLGNLPRRLSLPDAVALGRPPPPAYAVVVRHQGDRATPEGTRLLRLRLLRLYRQSVTAARHLVLQHGERPVGAPRRLGAAVRRPGALRRRPAGLRAWVGLHGGEGYEPDGYLCSCDVPHRGRRRRARAAPGWKLGKERLFLEDPERHVDAKLVDMGGGRFFLVDILTREGVSWEESVGDGDRCVLRLATGSSPHGSPACSLLQALQPSGRLRLASVLGVTA
jgi:hypothetical protein